MRNSQDSAIMRGSTAFHILCVFSPCPYGIVGVVFHFDSGGRKAKKLPPKAAHKRRGWIRVPVDKNKNICLPNVDPEDPMAKLMNSGMNVSQLQASPAAISYSTRH